MMYVPSDIPEGDDPSQNGDYVLSNGMKVKSGGTGSELETNRVIPLETYKLGYEYDGIDEEWQSHHTFGQLARLVESIIAKRQSQQNDERITKCYFLTSKWQQPPVAARGGLGEEWRFDITNEERKALFQLAVFKSIVSCIEGRQFQLTTSIAHHAQFKRDFLEEQKIQVLDEWNWDELDLSHSFVFNAGIDPDQLAIVMDLEPALLFGEQQAMITDLDLQSHPSLGFNPENGPPWLKNVGVKTVGGDTNVEAFTEMQAKFSGNYVQYTVDATEQDAQGDDNPDDPDDPEDPEDPFIPKPLGIKASEFYHKQLDLRTPYLGNEHEDEYEGEEHEDEYEGEEHEDEYEGEEHDQHILGDESYPNLNLTNWDEWPAEDGLSHEEEGEENHEHAAEDANGWYDQY